MPLSFSLCQTEDRLDHMCAKVAVHCAAINISAPADLIFKGNPVKDCKSVTAVAGMFAVTV